MVCPAPSVPAGKSYAVRELQRGVADGDIGSRGDPGLAAGLGAVVDAQHGEDAVGEVGRHR